MKKTAEQAELAEGRDQEKQNYGLVNQLRRFANLTYTARFAATTAATGVLTAAWTSDTVPEGVTWAVFADVIGIARAGGTGRAWYELKGLFYRTVGGVLTQEGATSVPLLDENPIGLNATLAISGNTVVVQVQDDGVLTMSWSVLIRAREAS